MEVRRRRRSRYAEGKDLLRESKAFPDRWFMGRSRQYGYDRRHQADETIVGGRAAHKAFCWPGKRGGSPKRFIGRIERSEEHTSELQSPMRISYAVFCL